MLLSAAIATVRPAPRRLLAALAVVALVATAGGCVPVMWATPQLDHFLSTDVAAPADQVHVFRVEVTERDSGRGHLIGRASPNDVSEDYYQLRQLAVLDDGQVPSQTLLSWQKRSGTYYPIEIISSGYRFEGSHEGRQYLLRFYRPGFELIEVAPWQRVAQLDWEPALDLISREKAIDALVSVESGGKGDFVESILEPGTVDRAHRRALLFAVDEYDRLASQEFSAGLQPDDVRKRIREKAARLRKLADGKAAPAADSEVTVSDESDSKEPAESKVEKKQDRRQAE